MPKRLVVKGLEKSAVLSMDVSGSKPECCFRILEFSGSRKDAKTRKRKETLAVSMLAEFLATGSGRTTGSNQQ